MPTLFTIQDGTERLSNYTGLALIGALLRPHPHRRTCVPGSASELPRSGDFPTTMWSLR